MYRCVFAADTDNIYAGIPPAGVCMSNSAHFVMLFAPMNDILATALSPAASALPELTITKLSIDDNSTGTWHECARARARVHIE